jgi:hypothetical protein
MISEEILQQILQAFTGEMDEKYYLVYTHYDESFDNSPEIIQKCMEAKEDYPLSDLVNDWFCDCRYENSLEIVDDLKDSILSDEKYANIHPYIEEWLEDDENREHLTCCIMERDYSNPAKELISRTRFRARITQFSNYETLPSNWDMGNKYQYQDYFKDIVDTLHLNPAKVKQALNKKGIDAEGIWVNLTYRNGREAVEYDDFADEVHNQTCNGHLVFMGMFPLDVMYDQGFRKYHKIIVPKGNSCGLYGSFNGGGSLLGMELKRDLVLPLQIQGKTKYDRFDLELDEQNCCNGYCIDEVYGLIRKAWGEEFQLLYQPSK